MENEFYIKRESNNPTFYADDMAQVSRDKPQLPTNNNQIELFIESESGKVNSPSSCSSNGEWERISNFDLASFGSDSEDNFTKEKIRLESEDSCMKEGERTLHTKKINERNSRILREAASSDSSPKFGSQNMIESNLIMANPNSIDVQNANRTTEYSISREDMINNGVRNAEYYRYIDANLEIYNYEALSEPGYMPRSTKNSVNMRNNEFCETTKSDTKSKSNLSCYNGEIKMGLGFPTNADICEIRNEPLGNNNCGKMYWYKNVTMNSHKHKRKEQNNAQNDVDNRANHVNNISLRNPGFEKDGSFEICLKKDIDILSQFDIQDYEDVEMNESFMYPSSVEKKTKSIQQLNSYLKSGAPLIQIYRPSCKRLLVQSHDEYESDGDQAVDESGLKAASIGDSIDIEINLNDKELNNVLKDVDQENGFASINSGSGTIYHEFGYSEKLIAPPYISKKGENVKDQVPQQYFMPKTSNGNTTLTSENLYETQCDLGRLKSISRRKGDNSVHYQLVRDQSDTNKTPMEAIEGSKAVAETGHTNPNTHVAETAHSMSIKEGRSLGHGSISASSKGDADKEGKKVRIVEKNIKMLREQFEACSVLKVRSTSEPRETRKCRYWEWARGDSAHKSWGFSKSE
ncbi:hypothetical protein AYI69_g5021 [Smittium culicis]|uniref:Uncharacterized protein n=1 Tax=Smittium culicis TaxID=133412 RepID=A0A1R1Y921_9FUNG|nr:hypothetical protein AYI69_g5021 [Smittium culicis]